MKTWTIKKSITFGFAASLAITLVLGGLSYQCLTSIQSHSDLLLKDAIPGTVSILQITSHIKENLGLAQAHVSATAEKARYGAQIAANVEEIDKLVRGYEESITTDADRQLFTVFTNNRAVFVQSFKHVLALSSDGKTPEAAREAAEKMMPAFATLDETLEKMIALNEGNLRGGTDSIQDAVARGRKSVAIGIPVAVALGMLLSWLIVRGIIRVLRVTCDALEEGADQVASASSQVSSASQTLASGASEQAASLEETSASLEEMASMTRRNADNSQSAKTLAAQTRAAADTGAADMDDMKKAMNEIKTSSSEVAKIVKDIDEIAFQTNILALNAAVEAARAGEAGAGFAVVADEVRNLAQRSAKSAKETADKIEAAIAKSERGVQISDKVAASLQEIVGKVRQVDELVAGIATASSEQSQGIGQVNTAVTQMDKVTQSNAASAEESASAAEELSSQAESVKESVRELQHLVGGAAEAAQSASNVTPDSRPVAATRHRNGQTPAHTVTPRRNAHASALALDDGRNAALLSARDDIKTF